MDGKRVTAQDAGFVLDLQQLKDLKRSAAHKDPKALRLAAQQFEALFVQQLFKSMRKTEFDDGFMDGGQGEQMYRQLLDQQWAQKIAQGKGLGLADMLVRQLSSPHGEKLTQSGEHKKIPAFSVPANARDVSPRREASAASSSVGPGPTVSAGDVQGGRRSALAQARQFIASILPAAREAAQALGVNPLAVLTHAALETGWGKHVPHDGNGRPSFNLFGIKAAGWEGQAVQARTREFQHGMAQTKQAAFRAYHSLEDGIRDYARFLLDNKRYQHVLKQGNNLEGFADGLQRAGYASDPAYKEKFLALAKGKLMREVMSGLGLSAH